MKVALRLHPAGTLYLTLSYTNLLEAYDRRGRILRRMTTNPEGPPPKVFGADLEAVLDREAPAGLSVPVIVKRCVEEVERRGMDIIGIYR